jgi:phage-related protein
LSFLFFYQGNLIVLANVFQKKLRKTPKNAIEFAIKIKSEYENESSHANYTRAGLTLRLGIQRANA